MKNMETPPISFSMSLAYVQQAESEWHGKNRDRYYSCESPETNDLQNAVASAYESTAALGSKLSRGVFTERSVTAGEEPG